MSYPEELRYSKGIELWEERIEQETHSFCVKHENKKDFIALCQIAFLTNPTKNHCRKMYNEFNLCTASARQKILDLNKTDKLSFNDSNWWHEYLTCFEYDYREYELGEERFLYSFGQYLNRLLDYGNASIVEFTQFIFPQQVQESQLELLVNHKYDLPGFIDEYIYYRNDEKEKGNLESPMNYMWREFDFDECPEIVLISFLALFIIGTCHAIPSKGAAVNKPFCFSGPNIHNIETAEDLFYLTILTLYENYGKNNTNELVYDKIRDQTSKE